MEPLRSKLSMLSLPVVVLLLAAFKLPSVTFKI
jgi:hypothetical protein